MDLRGQLATRAVATGEANAGDPKSGSQVEAMKVPSPGAQRRSTGFPLTLEPHGLGPRGSTFTLSTRQYRE